MNRAAPKGLAATKALRTLAPLLVCGLIACSAGPRPEPPAAPPLASIARLDQTRYLGGWYEIAKFPNWFQRHCASDTKAEYSLLADGSIEVLNRCRTAAGKSEQATGIARSRGPSDSSRLEVTFVPEWLRFASFLWADYWVIDIDPAYRLVAVSEPRRRYLWILSRTPQVDAKAYDALVERLEKQGFDITRLQRTAQSS